MFPNIGTSSYNSLQMQVTRHFKSGFAMLGAYTWSKAIGLADNAIDSENVADVFNRSLERVDHQLSLSACRQVHLDLRAAHRSW